MLLSELQRGYAVFFFEYPDKIVIIRKATGFSDPGDGPLLAFQKPPGQIHPFFQNEFICRGVKFLPEQPVKSEFAHRKLLTQTLDTELFPDMVCNVLGRGVYMYPVSTA